MQFDMIALFVEKVNYVVVGEEPGPAKLEKARMYGIATLSEDELLDLILTKSGRKPMYAKQTGNEPEEYPSSDVEIKKSPTKSKGLSQSTSSKKTETMLVTNIKNATGISESSAHHKGKSEKIDTISITSPKNSSKTSIINTASSKPAVNIKKLSNSISTKKDEDEIPNTTKRFTLPVKTFEKTSSKEPTSTTSVPSVSVNWPQKADVPDDNIAWTEKYKPKATKNIIGQQGERSNMKKLIIWLTNWHKFHGSKNNIKVPKPSPWAKNDDGAYFKCALLSGPPGIGKHADTM